MSEQLISKQTAPYLQSSKTSDPAEIDGRLTALATQRNMYADQVVLLTGLLNKALVELAELKANASAPSPD
jgi:hypothetical protein